MIQPIVIKMIDGVSATTTSDIYSLEGVRRCTLQFTRTNHSAGSSAFAIDVSIDGTNFVALNKLIDNVTNTNAQNLTRVASSSLSSNTSKVYTLDLTQDVYKYFRCTCTITTDGKGYATAYLENEN